jgi:hypothetical protein
MTCPPAAMAKPACEETNAFQAVGPLMKEHLGLLELSETKESKIAHVANFFSDLIISEKRDQLEKAGVNSNKGQTFASCQVPHDKRRRLEVTTKGRATQSAFNRCEKQSCNMQVDAMKSDLNMHACVIRNNWKLAIPLRKRMTLGLDPRRRVSIKI